MAAVDCMTAREKQIHAMVSNAYEVDTNVRMEKNRAILCDASAHVRYAGQTIKCDQYLLDSILIYFISFAFTQQMYQLRRIQPR